MGSWDTCDLWVWGAPKPVRWHVHGAAQIRRGGSFEETSHAARRDLRPTGSGENVTP
jgi:hypothetical protein